MHQIRVRAEVAALIRGLGVPGDAAAVSYGAGCRIRHVSVVTPRHRHLKRGEREPVIIVSRKLLRKAARASEASRQFTVPGRRTTQSASPATPAGRVRA